MNYKVAVIEKDLKNCIFVFKNNQLNKGKN